MNMNFTGEARLGLAFIVACFSIGLVVLMTIAGAVLPEDTWKPHPDRDAAICIADHGAYGCFEDIVRDRIASDEGKKARLKALAGQIDAKSVLDSCTLTSKVSCAFHVVDFGVMPWVSFHDYTGWWPDFDSRVEASNHCKRDSCLTTKVPLPDVDWKQGA